MRVLGLAQVENFKADHADSRKPLERWLSLVRDCSASSFVELKMTFPSADQVGAATIFDVGGNKFRVISKVTYLEQVVLITNVLTHEEYDRNKW